MKTADLDSAILRIETALARAERAAEASALGGASNAPDPELTLLAERHEKLKQAVAQGLQQIDEMLAGMPSAEPK